MAKVKVAFKNVLDKRATYKIIEKNSIATAALEYARLYHEDSDIYTKIVAEKIVIKLNNKVVEVDEWNSTPLRDDDKILITPVLEGGDSGGILQAIIGVVLIVVGAFMSNPTIVLLGISMLLGGAMALLADTDLPTFSHLSDKSSSNTYSWSGIKTQARPDQPVPIVYGKHMVGGNLISIFTERQGADDYLYMLLALCEGEIAGICTENNTNNVCTTTDYDNANYKHPYILLDDQPFQNYSDVEWWYRTGTNLPDATKLPTDPTVQNIIPHFSGSRMQMDDNRPLSTEGIVYTTTKEVDMATIQIQFPAMFNANGGDVGPSSVTYSIQFKKNGDATWLDFNQTRYDPIVTPQERSPGIMSPLKTWGDGIKFNSLVPHHQNGGAYALTEQKPDSMWMRVTVSGGAFPPMPSLEGNYDYYSPVDTMYTTYTFTIKNLTTNEITTETRSTSQSIYWTEGSVDEWTNTRSGYWRGNSVVSIDSNRLSIGPYDVTVPIRSQHGDTYIFSATKSSSFWTTISNKSKTAFWSARTIDFHNVTGGEGKQIYDLRVKRQNPLSSDFNTANNAILNSVIEILNGDFIYPNTALLGFRIKATDQISGSPPNINLMVKGMKIQVPDHSGTESFEEIFWDNDDNRWEYDGAERTWDGTTYVNEYSNNSMLCLKDLMVNKVYGLGEYTNIEDFDTANIISIFKECHIEYAPTQTDYTKWWDAGNPIEFAKSIESNMTTIWGSTLAINSTAKTITYANAYSHWIPIRLDAPLKSGQTYRFSITLSGTSSNVDIDLSTLQLNGKYYQLGDYTAPEISDAGDGTHTYSFTVPDSGVIGMLINIYKTGEARNINGTITDISVNSIVGTGAGVAWHYHTFNGVFDSHQAALSTLMEFTNSFRVWPSWYEGTFQFIMDKDETPIHTLSISNTVSFAQSWHPLSEIPYRIVAQFTDEDKKYEMTQIMVQSSDSTIPKTNVQTIGLKGVTNRKRAEREVKFRLSKFTNATHTVTIRCGIDMIHATAGDIINVSNDLPQWGHGSRVASYNAASKYIYLTERYTVTATNAADIMIKYQDSNNKFQTATLNITGISEGDKLRRVKTITWPANPQINGPLALGISTSYVKKFRLMSVQRNTDEEIEINAVEHIPTIYSSEPTLVVQQDYETQELNSVIGKPGKPKNITFRQLLPVEGIGWDIQAEHADQRSQEIIVEMGEGLNANDYHQVGVILQGQTTMRYMNPQLKTGITYSFRFYAKNPTSSGPSVYTNIFLEKQTFDMRPVTGMNIKGSDPLLQTWDGLDVTIQWNPAGQDWYRSGMMDFYSLYIYHTTYDPQNPNTNLLRTAYPKKTEYKYTYDMNVEDNGIDNVKGTLIFIISANLINGIESPRSRPFMVSNVAPIPPANLGSEAWGKKARFFWRPNTQTDFRQFEYRTRVTDASGVAVGTWSSYLETKNTDLTRSLTATEQTTYNDFAKVRFNIKTVDLYGNYSAVASIAQNVVTLNVGQGDITDFAVKASNIFTKIPILDEDNWTNDNPSAGYVNWDDHFIYYNGVSYLIASSNTDQKYIWWEYQATTYSASNTNPASILDPDDFIIATNSSGEHSLAWNAMANQLVGNAYIENAAINNAKIKDLAVTNAKVASLDATKITAGFLSANRLAASIITAEKIRGDDFGTLNLSSGKVVITAASGLVINSAYGIQINPGGDINFQPSSGDNSVIRFRTALATQYYNMYSSYGSGYSLRIEPQNGHTGKLLIGGTNGFSRISLYAAHNLNIKCDDGGDEAQIDLTGTHIRGRAQNYWVWHTSSDGFRPVADSSFNLGGADFCWLNVYADAGITACSGEKFKTDIQQENLGLNFINAIVPVRFKWNKKENRNLKGTYRGIIAEEVEQALIDIGESATSFAGVVKKQLVDGSEWHGFKYDQLFSPIIKSIQELDEKIELLK